MKFSGGEKLEAALRSIAKRVERPETLRVGFLEGATYPDGTPVPLVAANNEYGTSKQPARPFFRTMIAAKSPKWPDQLARVMKLNNLDPARSLALMGEGIGSQLQESIRTFNGVKLAQSTIDAKGFEKQLIDTTQMINSVQYEVNDSGKRDMPIKISPPAKRKK